MNLPPSLKLAFRSLKRDKTFSLINIIGLSLGLVSCAFVSIYSYQSLTYDQYHTDHSHIYRINSSWIGTTDKRSMAITAPIVGARLKDNYSFVSATTRISAMNGQMELVKGEQTFELSNFRYCDADVMDVFTFHMVNGSKENGGLFINDEWANKIFGTIDCVGEIVSIDGEKLTIGGVYKRWPQNIDLPIEGVIFQQFADDNREQFAFMTYARINSSEAALHQALSQITEQVYSTMEFGNEKIMLEAQPMDGLHFSESILGDLPKGNKTYTYLAMGTAIILLIVVLINISNLSIIRSVDAIRMNGIRKILGASNLHINWHQTLQTLTFFVISSLIAVTLFQVFRTYFTELTGIHIRREEHLILLLGFGISFLLLMLLTSWYSERISNLIKPIQALKNQFTNQLPGGKVRKALVVFQFIVTGLVISGLLILTLQWSYIQNKNLGFIAENVAIVSLLNRDANAPVLQAEISGIVGEQNISLGTWGALPGGDVSFTTANVPSIETDIPVNVIDYDHNFFHVFGMQIQSGTVPTNHITDAGAKQPILVNQTLAAMISSAEGKEVNLPWIKGVIQGVLSDYHYQSLHNKIEPLLLIPIGDRANYTHIFIKTPVNQYAAIEKQLGQLLNPADYKLQWMDQQLLKNYKQEQEAIAVIFYFSIISLFISILGVFGVVSYILRKREYEIGIRKILGANRSNLYKLFGSELLFLLLIASVVCLPLAYYLKVKILNLYAFHVHLEWWYLLLPLLLTVLCAMSIVMIQITKASKLNPAKLLRNE